MSEYSENIHRIQIEDREILLIGTAHVSQESVIEVEQTIEEFQPDTVCVELCASRFEAMRNEQRWKDMDIFKVIREGKTFLLLSNLILTAFQKKIGEQIGVKPGAEMRQAIESAEKINATIVLADRNVEITLRRTWTGLSFWEKAKIISQLIGSLFVSEKISAEEIEQLKGKDVLAEVMEGFAVHSPTLKQILIDERDQYLAGKIATATGKKIVAVVGAGHVQGILQEVSQEQNLQKLEELPPKKIPIFKWLIPSLIIGMIVYGFLQFDRDVSIEMIQYWVLINGTLSALGALLAWGHPLTVISAFIAAPITSLNPAIAAGWVSGIVETMMHKPQVKDFENLNQDLTHFKGFWKNKVTRILLVVVFSNLGSSLGTFIGGLTIFSLL